jgi:hypothetical protein
MGRGMRKAIAQTYEGMIFELEDQLHIMRKNRKGASQHPPDSSPMQLN